MNKSYGEEISFYTLFMDNRLCVIRKYTVISEWFFCDSRNSRSSPPNVFLWKSVLKICSKLTGKHPSRSVILIKLLCNFNEIALWHGCSLVNLLNIFKTRFPKNTFGGLLLMLTFNTKAYYISKRNYVGKKVLYFWLFVFKQLNLIDKYHENIFIGFKSMVYKGWLWKCN